MDMKVVSIASSGGGGRDESTNDGLVDAEGEEQAAERRTKGKGPWDGGQGEPQCATRHVIFATWA